MRRDANPDAARVLGEIPVYPDETDAMLIAETLGVPVKSVRAVFYSMTESVPMAERVVMDRRLRRMTTLYCFPSETAKRQAIEMAKEGYARRRADG